jgi:hypothetical protein
VLLVIDGCPPQDRAAVWGALKGRSDRVRLVTLDQGPEDAHDAQMRVLPVPPLGREELADIFSAYVPWRLEALRWAEFCEGSPRAAHAVGLNLRESPEDLLRPPATVDVWDRYVCGRDQPHTETVEQRRLVLRHLALFERFGFEHPVEPEARFIQCLAAGADPGITWPRFQAVVQELRARRILQGRTTLHITPRLLQNRLYRDFWEYHGRGLDLGELLCSMPGGLRPWFIEMLRFAHTSAVATEAVRRLLGRQGPLTDEALLDSGGGSRLLAALTETDPRAALRCLQLTLGRWDRERLLGFTHGRRGVVEALERMAVREDLFADAAGLLLALGEAETERYATNASGVFAGLFSLVPGMAVTQAPPARRLPALRGALASDSPRRRQLGLAACRQALSGEPDFRPVGPEHQGLRPGVRPWRPATWGELGMAYRQVWELLVEETARWEPAERQQANDVLITSARGGLLALPGLADPVLGTLERLAGGEATDRRRLVEAVTWMVRHAPSRLEAGALERLRRLEERLQGVDFSSRLRRFITLRVWVDEVGEDGKVTDRPARELQTLAAQAVEAPARLEPELPWLVTDRTGNSGMFGSWLGERDLAGVFLDPIVQAQRSAGGEGTPFFLGSYLAAYRQRDRDRWEQVVLQLAEDAAVRVLLCELIFRSGISESVARRAIELAEGGEIPVREFRVWCCTGRCRELSDGLAERLRTLLRADGTPESIRVAFELYHADYCREPRRGPLPDPGTFELLTHDAVFCDDPDQSPPPYWEDVAARYTADHPGRALDLLEHVLGRCDRYECRFLGRGSGARSALDRIVRLDPAGSWERIAGLLDDLDTARALHVLNWLEGDDDAGEDSPGVVALFPAERLWVWADGDRTRRVFRLAGLMPKTLDPANGGALTQAFLCRYGDEEGVQEMLMSHIGVRGGWGAGSAQYRRLLDQARGWLAAGLDPRVAAWTERYIHTLEERIREEEVAEERGW